MTEAPRPATPPLARLKSAADFERVRREGRSHAHPLIVLIARRHSSAAAGEAPGPVTPEVCRVGIVAGRGVGTAVRRNRAKRLLREALRAWAGRLAPGWDLVLIARRPLAESNLASTQAALEQLLRRAKLLVHES